MSIAKFTPAVTETKTVEVSPAKITLELTVTQAKHLAALTGNCNSANVDAYHGEDVQNYHLHSSLTVALRAAGKPYEFTTLASGPIRYAHEA